MGGAQPRGRGHRPAGWATFPQQAAVLGGLRSGGSLDGDRNDYHANFGPTNVALHQVAVASGWPTRADPAGGRSAGLPLVDACTAGGAIEPKASGLFLGERELCRWRRVLPVQRCQEGDVVLDVGTDFPSYFSTPNRTAPATGRPPPRDRAPTTR